MQDGQDGGELRLVDLQMGRKRPVHRPIGDAHRVRTSRAEIGLSLFSDAPLQVNESRRTARVKSRISKRNLPSAEAPAANSRGRARPPDDICRRLACLATN